MECEEYKPQIDLLVTGFLDQSLLHDLQRHLESCPDCRMELETTRKIWMLMGEFPTPVPSEVMRANFHAMLAKFKSEDVHPNVDTATVQRNARRTFFMSNWFKVAAAIFLLLTGFGTGYLSNRPGQPAMAANNKMDSLAFEMSAMKQMMMLSLLENPSASERIRAVGYSDQIGSPNKKVIDALLTTLNQDPNVNVRLITLDALARLSKDPSVREGLVQSITVQESPLVQSAIADLMVKLQEKRSIKSLQKLLHKKDLNETIKSKIEESIQKLI